MSKTKIHNFVSSMIRKLFLSLLFAVLAASLAYLAGITDIAYSDGDAISVENCVSEQCPDAEYSQDYISPTVDTCNNISHIRLANRLLKVRNHVHSNDAYIGSHDNMCEYLAVHSCSYYLNLPHRCVVPNYIYNRNLRL